VEIVQRFFRGFRARKWQRVVKETWHVAGVLDRQKEDQEKQKREEQEQKIEIQHKAAVKMQAQARWWLAQRGVGNSITRSSPHDTFRPISEKLKDGSKENDGRSSSFAALQRGSMMSRASRATSVLSTTIDGGQSTTVASSIVGAEDEDDHVDTLHEDICLTCQKCHTDFLEECKFCRICGAMRPTGAGVGKVLGPRLLSRSVMSEAKSGPSQPPSVRRGSLDMGQEALMRLTSHRLALLPQPPPAPERSESEPLNKAEEEALEEPKPLKAAEGEVAARDKLRNVVQTKHRTGAALGNIARMVSAPKSAAKQLAVRALVPPSSSKDPLAVPKDSSESKDSVASDPAAQPGQSKDNRQPAVRPKP